MSETKVVLVVDDSGRVKMQLGHDVAGLEIVYASSMVQANRLIAGMTYPPDAIAFNVKTVNDDWVVDTEAYWRKHGWRSGPIMFPIVPNRGDLMGLGLWLAGPATQPVMLHEVSHTLNRTLFPVAEVLHPQLQLAI